MSFEREKMILETARKSRQSSWVVLGLSVGSIWAAVFRAEGVTNQVICILMALACLILFWFMRSVDGEVEKLKKTVADAEARRELWSRQTRNESANE